jgi:hypothetical protein
MFILLFTNFRFRGTFLPVSRGASELADPAGPRPRTTLQPLRRMATLHLRPFPLPEYDALSTNVKEERIRVKNLHLRLFLLPEYDVLSTNIKEEPFRV